MQGSATSNEGAGSIRANTTIMEEQLAKKLRIPDFVESAEDMAEHLCSIKGELIAGIERQNRKFTVEKSNVAGASFALVGAGIGIASDPYSAAQILGTIGSSVAVATAWISLSKLFKNQQNEAPTLYQGFRQIQVAQDRQESRHKIKDRNGVYYV